MKKILAMLLALVMVLALAGCSSTDYTSQLDEIAESLESVQDTLESYIAAEETAAEEAEAAEEAAESTYSGELIVFAAASMTETLTEIGDLFMEANPDVEIVFNFDSSGTLKTQIEEGADCDVFISAGQKQMDQLDITADESVNTDGLDYVISETRFDILENKVTLAVPEGNPAGIESFDQLAELLAAGDVFLAMGNEDVPVGQYTQLILEYYGLDEDELASNGCITYGSNVKEVTTQVSEGTVDCGIIYATDAYSAGLTVVDSATAEMCGQVIYPAAVLNITSNQELAEAFLEFCTSDEASAILESVGFTPLA
ncbi:MAG: molybdate ABC transporter substrate-binding protein [Oscillospiraceae bacterium]|nr:molybdate ABC transporter substrate-binding protein [Oscillospiraceae bacterium]